MDYSLLAYRLNLVRKYSCKRSINDEIYNKLKIKEYFERYNAKLVYPFKFNKKIQIEFNDKKINLSHSSNPNNNIYDPFRSFIRNYNCL